MQRHIALVCAALIAAACCPVPARVAVPRSVVVEPCEECLCDCPDGPPKPPKISTFCLSDANDGAACCLGNSLVGLCVNHECALPIVQGADK